MKSWNEFALEDPELAKIGKELLFRTRIGLAFLATLRKDGAPRLHPVSLFLCKDHLYVGIPATSPKCGDLQRDGRYALQAFPTPDGENQEFYIAGSAEAIQDATTRQQIIQEAQVQFGEDEMLFELLLDRAMHTKLENWGTPDERPVHKKWRATEPSTVQ